MAKINFLATFLIVITISAIFFPPFIQAALRINEAYTHPVTGQQEWVELYLPHGDFNTDVGGWSLWDTESSPSLLFTFESGTNLSAGSYFVPSMKNKLNNTGDTIVLKDSNFNIIDIFSYTNGESEKSWSLMEDGSIQLTEPTKGSANVFPPVTPIPTAIPTSSPTPTIPPQPHPKITRFMACPKIGNEWVELYNPHETTISLENYELWDAKNRFHRFDATDTLVAKQTTTVQINQSILNNTGDILALYSPNNELVESFSYDTCDSLIPWGKNDDDTWVLDSVLEINNTSGSISSNNSDQGTGQILGGSISKNPVGNISGSTSTIFKFPSLPDFKLKTSPLVWDYSENVIFFTNHLTIWGGLSVIIGGLLMGGPSTWNFYVKKQTAQFEKDF